MSATSYMVNKPQIMVNKPQSMVNKPQSMVNKPQSMVNKPQSMVNQPQSLHTDSTTVCLIVIAVSFLGKKYINIYVIYYHARIKSNSSVAGSPLKTKHNTSINYQNTIQV